jgi:hypothetical protein
VGLPARRARADIATSDALARSQVHDDVTVPLVVDMDGTYFSSDSNDLMLRALRRRPLRAFAAKRLLRRGEKASFKLYLHEHSGGELDRFEVYAPVQALVERERAHRPVYLATGAPQALAEAAAARFAPDRFAGVFGTHEGHNNTASRKAARLVERFGEGGFDYAGNAPADLAVWEHARRAYVCNAPAGLADEAARVCEVAEVL